MRLTTISAVYERKLDLGEWNSVRAGITLWANLEEDDDPATCAEALRQMARNNVMAELGRAKPNLAAKVENLFMGLPVEVRSQMEK
jgi:hypothetical protein